jgi:hypothetical protein
MSETYKSEEYGYWVAKGEDPNCDFGGPHSSPVLGYFEGKYKHVLSYAKTLPGWFTWGYGGRVEKSNIEFVKIDEFSIEERARLENKKAVLLEELKNIDKELN